MAGGSGVSAKTRMGGVTLLGLSVINGRNSKMVLLILPAAKSRAGQMLGIGRAKAKRMQRSWMALAAGEQELHHRMQEAGRGNWGGGN